MRIEERAFELRPESLRTAARGRRADDARIRAPRRAQTLDVVARHQDVAAAMTIQSYAAARQPLQTLLSFGLSPTVSLPMSSRAGTCGCAAIRRRTSGAAASLALAAQKIISSRG